MRSQVDYSLYLITDEGMCAERGVTAVVADAVAGGAGIVQVRAKGRDDDELAAQVRAVRAAVAQAGLAPVPVVVNDSVAAARASGADGVHLGQSDGDPVAARATLGPEAIIGLSVSTPDQIRDATALGVLDYLGVGPVWATATKPNHPPPLGPQVCQDLAALADPVPCVVVGGIDASRVAELVGRGFAGICVVSAVCAAADPQAAAAELRAAWDGSAWNAAEASE